MDDGHGWSAEVVRLNDNGFYHEHLGTYPTGEQAASVVIRDHMAMAIIAA
jgi:hypothetical protein